MAELDLLLILLSVKSWLRIKFGGFSKFIFLITIIWLSNIYIRDAPDPTFLEPGRYRFQKFSGTGTGRNRNRNRFLLHRFQ